MITWTLVQPATTVLPFFQQFVKQFFYGWVKIVPSTCRPEKKNSEKNYVGFSIYFFDDMQFFHAMQKTIKVLLLLKHKWARLSSHFLFKPDKLEIRLMLSRLDWVVRSIYLIEEIENSDICGSKTLRRAKFSCHLTITKCLFYIKFILSNTLEVWYRPKWDPSSLSLLLNFQFSN